MPAMKASTSAYPGDQSRLVRAVLVGRWAVQRQAGSGIAGPGLDNRPANILENWYRLAQERGQESRIHEVSIVFLPADRFRSAGLQNHVADRRHELPRCCWYLARHGGSWEQDIKYLSS